MPRLIRAMRSDAVKEERGSLAVLDGREIALFKRDGRFYALSNICSHQHHPVLYRGELDRCTVECPMHGWTYDLASGRAVKGDGRVATYRVEIRDGDLFVELPDE